MRRVRALEPWKHPLPPPLLLVIKKIDPHYRLDFMYHRTKFGIFSAFFKKQFYIAFVNIFRFFHCPLGIFLEYVFRFGSYPKEIFVKTPIGKQKMTLYSSDDMITAVECFGKLSFLFFTWRMASTLSLVVWYYYMFWVMLRRSAMWKRRTSIYRNFHEMISREYRVD